jgi:drug/metabolite transporter (DMT)-like permease
MATSNNFKGAMFMTSAMASFTINDAMVKLVTPDLNTGQIMLIRGAMTTALVLLVAWKLNALRPLRTVLNPFVAARIVCEIGASISYVLALSFLPLPNTSAILQALPLAVTMGAAIFLAEPVGWRRWSAILVGFAGVLIIIRPGVAGFSAASLLVVISVVTAAARDIVTRKIDASIPTLFVSGATSLSVTIAGGLLIPAFGGWKPVPITDFGALAFGAVMLFAGYQTIILAMRTGEISFIAPFRYTSLLWAIGLGIVLLSEMPDFWTLIGSGIVIAAGLYAFYREAKLHRDITRANSNLTAN